MDRSQAQEGEQAMQDEDWSKLTKLTKLEGIEAFLTTFERMMQAYGMKEDHWAF